MSELHEPLNGEQPAALCSSDLLAAVIRAAEERRELLMSVRGKTLDGQDRDNLQWRAQAMDDLVEVMREVLKAANDPSSTTACKRQPERKETDQ